MGGNKFINLMLLTSVALFISSCGTNGYTPESITLTEFATDSDFIKGITKNNANEKNSKGSTPIMMAAFKNKPDRIKVLLDNGANINESDNDGWTALHYAADQGNTEAVAYLLRNGANPNAKTKGRRQGQFLVQYGWVPIKFAIKNNYYDIVGLLKDKTDLNITDVNGDTIYEYANNNFVSEQVSDLINGRTKYTGYKSSSASSKVGDTIAKGILLYAGAAIVGSAKEVSSFKAPNNNHLSFHISTGEFLPSTAKKFTVKIKGTDKNNYTNKEDSSGNGFLLETGMTNFDYIQPGNYEVSFNGIGSDGNSVFSMATNYNYSGGSVLCNINATRKTMDCNTL